MKLLEFKKASKKFFTHRNFILFFASLVLVFVLGNLNSVEKSTKVSAGSQHNLSGYAWSDNIGWLSFNCTNDGGSCAPDYGVNVDTSTGVFSGYAWSDNIGWVSFNSADMTGCPSSPCAPTIDTTTGVVTGWAKVLSAGGGWDGWIKLSGTSNDDSTYGASFLGANASGYSWGDVVVGWLSWKGPSYGVLGQTTIINPGPDVAITSPVVNPLNTDTASPVGFVGTASSQTGSITAYEWRSGNCQTGTLLNSTISFQQLMPLGTTTVYFRAEDDQNVWSLSCPNIVVHATAPLPINGACGSANGGGSGVAPATGLCLAGSATTTPVLSGGSWVWGCQGMYDGIDTNSCSTTNTCGNGICERDKSETPSSCRSDCPVNFREI